MGVGSYGLKVYRRGIELRGDGRERETLPGGYKVIARRRRHAHYRGKIRAWSKASAQRLAFIVANVDLFFRSHVTLTYRATQQAWESLGERNLRFVRRCRADLHRFLMCVRSELGEYLWVREFQERGVVHFHLLCERDLPGARAAQAWSRATDQAHDEAVLRHGVKVDAIASQDGVRHYLGQYVGKEKQKDLPVGVDGAGRWWGRSRGLVLVALEEIVWLDRSEGVRRPIQLRIVRVLRQYLEKRFKRRYRGGAFVDYGGQLAATLCDLAVRLRGHYGWSPGLLEMLEQNGWELIPGEDGDGQGVGESGRSGSADSVGAAGSQVGSDGEGAVQASLFA